jgi:hypothetical protein
MLNKCECMGPCMYVCRHVYMYLHAHAYTYYLYVFAYRSSRHVCNNCIYVWEGDEKPAPAHSSDFFDVCIMLSWPIVPTNDWGEQAFLAAKPCKMCNNLN